MKLIIYYFISIILFNYKFIIKIFNLLSKHFLTFIIIIYHAYYYYFKNIFILLF